MDWTFSRKCHAPSFGEWQTIETALKHLAKTQNIPKNFNREDYTVNICQDFKGELVVEFVKKYSEDFEKLYQSYEWEFVDSLYQHRYL